MLFTRNPGEMNMNLGGDHGGVFSCVAASGREEEEEEEDWDEDDDEDEDEDEDDDKDEDENDDEDEDDGDDRGEAWRGCLRWYGSGLLPHRVR